MKEIFDTYVENAFCGYEQAAFKIQQFESNYKKHFPSDKDAVVLDIGIGRGEMLTCMKNWGYNNYLGVDISPSTVSFCTSLGLNCTLADDTAAWLSERKNVYDLVTLLDVLEHVKKEHIISFLKSIKNSLKDDGMLIIQVPNLQAPDGQLHRYNDITHEVGFVEHSLKQVLLTAGFQSVRLVGFEENVAKNIRGVFKVLLRSLFWKYVKFTRRISGNLNPEILSPVLIAIARK